MMYLRSQDKLIIYIIAHDLAGKKKHVRQSLTGINKPLSIH